MHKTINVAILIYPGVEVIDMNGPIDVFTKVNTYEKIKKKYHVFTVAETAGVVKCEGATVHIIPEFTLDNCPPLDIIVIPGQIMPHGSPHPFGNGSKKLVHWIKDQGQNPKTTIMSVCVGAYILAYTGLLNGKNATTHWQAIESLQKEYPKITMIKNVRYVADDQFVTTGGVTSGIDGALYLISTINGPDVAQNVADIMVYNRDAPLPPDTILP